MYIVYVLKDEDGRLYKGATSDLQRRLSEHRQRGTKTTSRMSEFKVVYQEQHESWESARKREKYLKTAAGRRFLKQVIED